MNINGNDHLLINPDAKKNWRNENWLINVYTCPAKHYTTTVDIHEGVTPFIIECPQCYRAATSAMYPRIRPVPELIPKPTIEWYKPNEAEIMRKQIHGDQLAHIQRGGLIPRKRTKVMPLCHKTPPHKA